MASCSQPGQGGLVRPSIYACVVILMCFTLDALRSETQDGECSLLSGSWLTDSPSQSHGCSKGTKATSHATRVLACSCMFSITIDISTCSHPSRRASYSERLEGSQSPHPSGSRIHHMSVSAMSSSPLLWMHEDNENFSHRLFRWSLGPCACLLATPKQEMLPTSAAFAVCAS